MPSWWGKSSSKDVKKKTKENLIDTLHRFIIPREPKGGTKARATRRHTGDTISDRGTQSRAESRSTSPSTQVSRCQSFADRPVAQPLPLPGSRVGVTRTSSEVGVSRPILEKRGKPQLHLPLPTPNCLLKRPDTTEVFGDFPTASVSSNCSVDDSDDPGDSQLHSPVGTDIENGSKASAKIRCSAVHKEQSPTSTQKNLREMAKPTNVISGNRSLSQLPRSGIVDNYQFSSQNHRQAVLESAPNSLMSSPSRSPIRICPDQIPTSAFWAVKPHADVTFLGSGQCSSPGSGQTSGHNSVGGDVLGQLFWQPSRGSPEYSPVPSPRMTSPGPGSRIHSGSVSPLHPRAGGMAPESPTGRNDEGKKQSHRLPLPPIIVSHSSPYSANNSTSNSPLSIPRSPGRPDNPPSPGSRWKKGKLIGRGTFGHVYVGFNSESGEMCAMKEVTLFLDDSKSKESAKQLGQEISLLSRLRHPNIVQYYGSEMVDDKLYIYLEYVSAGSIHKLLQEYGQLGEPAIRSYSQQILSGLAYLHAKNTVHRDIKGANILVDPNGRVKLADFGMAKHINGQSCPFSLKGSPHWMAPEVIKSANGCNLAVDIWSLGCTVLEMATSKPPWSQYEGIAAMFKIGLGKELPPMPDHLSDEGKDFIRQCLQREPSNRPTASELLEHPFVKNAAPLEKSLSVTVPLEWLPGLPSGSASKDFGHARNLCSLHVEKQTIQQRRAAKMAATPSDIHLRNNISCPVSPIGSPLLKSRSPQFKTGRMSPSPISSPRTMSGASTPLTGGNGAIPIPFNHLRQSAFHSEAFPLTSGTPHDMLPSGSTDPKLDLFLSAQQGPPTVRERIISEGEIMNPQLRKQGHGNMWDPYDRQPPCDHGSHQLRRDHRKSSPSLDLRSGSPILGRTHGS